MRRRLNAPLESVLYHSESLAIGVFDCPREHLSFQDSGPTAEDIVVFPRYPVYIKHTGKREVLANHQVVTLYNKGQTYQRQPVAAYGDYSVWFHFPREILVAAMEEVGQANSKMDSQPFVEVCRVSNRATFLKERLLYQYLKQCDQPSALLVEDAALQLLGQLFSTDELQWIDRKARKNTVCRHQDMVAHCLALLTQGLDQRLTLSELSTQIGTTPFHLSRVFKSQTGQSIHQYLLQLRLRNAVDAIFEQPKQRLTDIAMNLGFATPSHFAQSFRYHFGMSPGQLSIQSLGNILTTV